MNVLSDKQKVNYIRIIAVFSTLSMMLYAPKLWLTTKEFPIISFVDFLYVPTKPFDYILAIVFFILQIFYLFRWKRSLGLLLIAFYIYLALIDQNRLQPYFYQSFLTLLAIELFPRKGNFKNILYAIILIFFATYFWSGIHKLNSIFYSQWLHALEKHFNFIPKNILTFFTYCVPWLEAFLGISLLINKTRKLGVIGVVLMHSIICLMLLYLGYGFNVIPWNLQNILSILIIFWGLKTLNLKYLFFNNLIYQKSILLLFTCLLPFLNIFGYWDHLLSFSFFTSKLDYYAIEIKGSLQKELPDNVKKQFRYHNNKTYIYANEWAGNVNKVLFYPEKRAILKLEEYLNSFSKNKNGKETALIIYNKPKNVHKNDK